MARITLKDYDELFYLYELDRIARKYMANNNLSPHWTFVWDRSLNRGGQCRPRKREIGVSAYIAVTWTVEKFINTITHEIAHALVGTTHHHDAVWRAKHIELGGDGKRCWGTLTTGKYVGTCPNGHQVFMQRKSKIMKVNSSCNICAPGHYDSRFKVTWKENKS